MQPSSATVAILVAGAIVVSSVALGTVAVALSHAYEVAPVQPPAVAMAPLLAGPTLNGLSLTGDPYGNATACMPAFELGLLWHGFTFNRHVARTQPLRLQVHLPVPVPGLDLRWLQDHAGTLYGLNITYTTAPGPDTLTVAYNASLGPTTKLEGRLLAMVDTDRATFMDRTGSVMFLESTFTVRVWRQDDPSKVGLTVLHELGHVMGQHARNAGNVMHPTIPSPGIVGCQAWVLRHVHPTGSVAWSI
jgi:hypothetical protein